MEVEVQQCMELTNTNRWRADPKSTPKSEEEADEADSEYFPGAPKILRADAIFVSDSVFRNQVLIHEVQVTK